MISQLDKLYYDRFVNSHDVAKEVVDTHCEDFYSLVDYLYKGGLDKESTDAVQTLDEVNHVKAMANVCRNDGWRSVDTAANMLYVGDGQDLDLDGDIDDPDFKASLQNFYSSELFLEEMEEIKEGQNTLDLLVSKGDDNGLPSEPTEEEIKFRNWLQKKMHQRGDIKKIMKWFGNFYAHANKLKRESYHKHSEVQDVIPGDHIPDVVPTEFANLGVDELDVLFDYNFAMKQLMQYDRTKKTSGKEGPIVLALDKSGSMGDRIGHNYKKMNMAIGFTMAVVKAMNDDGRRCKVFTFTKSCEDIIFGDEPLATQLKRLLNVNYRGSTSLTRALEHGFKIADKDDDVIVVTDGIDEGIKPNHIDKIKGQRRVSTLLISQYTPESTGMAEASDSFIVANDEGGFDKLMADVINPS